jgi:hypothetical protein
VCLLARIAGVALIIVATRAYAEPAIIVDGGDLPERVRPQLEPLRTHVGVRIVSPVAAELPSRDALLGEARRSYGAMSWKHAEEQLARAEQRIVDGLPTRERTVLLAEVELFYAACLLLDNDGRTADERFVLARALSPTVTVDPIFPPEVARAFHAAKPGPSQPVTVTIAPEGARIWIDGVAGAATQLPSGLHYLVVERADRRPHGSIVRVSKSAARLSLAADSPASADEAMLALRSASEPAEALAVSRSLHASLWRLSLHDEALAAARFAASDAVRPTSSTDLALADPRALEKTVCAMDPCDAKESPPRGPVWKRSWFWGVIGAGAAVVVTGVVVGAVLGTRARDYEVIVR